MSEKKISLEELYILVGGSKKSTINVLSYLSKKEKPATIKEIVEGIGYGKKSNHIYVIMKRLVDLELIKKEKEKGASKYSLKHKRIIIDMD